MEKRKSVARAELRAAIRKAMRLGAWFKLDPLERAALEAASKALRMIKHPLLIRLYERLLDLIYPSRVLLREAYRIGLKLAELRIKQALSLGNLELAKRFLRKCVILALGLSYLNTPEFYRAEL